MLARSEEIGVRSSWLGVGDQMALGLHRALERVERGVEALRQPRELVVALDLEAPGQVEAAGERLGLRREPRDRRERCARDERPRSPASTMPPPPISARINSSLLSSCSTSVSGRAMSTAPLRADAEREHAQLGPLDAAVADQAPAAARGDRAVRGRDGDLRGRGALAAGHLDVAVG